MIAQQPHSRRDECSEDNNDTTQKRREQNAQIPVNQLPAEILAEIFLVWASHVLTAAHRRPLVVKGRGYHWWIIILHVCHLWREIVLNLPRFWSDFAATSAQLTEVMLLRSKKVPLDVHLYPSPALEEPTQRVLNHLHRIHSLTISTQPLELHRYVLGDSAPLLRSLIYNVEPGSNFGHSDSGTPFDHVDMPALCVLHLADSHCSWSSPLLKPTLKQLLWEEPYRGTAYRTSHMSNALRVLSSMPVLNELHLRSVLPPAPSEDVSTLADPFFLPHLRTLVLEASASSAACLLRHVTYPPNAHVYVHCTDQDEHALPILFSALSTKIATPDASSPIPQLSSVYIGIIELRAWDSDPGVDTLDTSSSEDSDLPPLLDITMQEAHRSLNLFLQHLDRVAPLANITTLYFEPSRWNSVDTAPWAAAAAAMINVRTVGVGRHGFEMLRGLLNTDVWAGRCGANRAPAFPQLEVLRLWCLWMRWNPNRRGQSLVYYGLRDTLRERAFAGLRFKRIELVNCINVMSADIELLYNWVDKVVWYGKRYTGTKGARDFKCADDSQDDDPALASIELAWIRSQSGDCDDSGDSDVENDDADDNDDNDEDP